MFVFVCRVLFRDKGWVTNFVLFLCFVSFGDDYGMTILFMFDVNIVVIVVVNVFAGDRVNEAICVTLYVICERITLWCLIE